MKLAGGCPSFAHELNVDAFLQQVGATPMMMIYTYSNTTLAGSASVVFMAWLKCIAPAA
jgi:hypothetical protein